MKYIFTRQMITPQSGPMANDPISAGSSERSILINDGINGTEKSRNIRIYATAESIAVTVRYLTLTLFTVTVLFVASISLVSFSLFGKCEGL